jgi:hypothetical protein
VVVEGKSSVLKVIGVICRGTAANDVAGDGDASEKLDREGDVESNDGNASVSVGAYVGLTGVMSVDVAEIVRDEGGDSGVIRVDVAEAVRDEDGDGLDVGEWCELVRGN